MLRYTTPGVYFQPVSDRLRPFPRYRTDIAAFVGIAERGPLFAPVKIESWQQFRAAFGAHIAAGYLAYAVEGFFANGGACCWVVRVADSEQAHAASVLLYDGLRLEASSPGSWGNGVGVTVERTGDDSFTLRLRTQQGDLEIWRNLALTPCTQEDTPTRPSNQRCFKCILNDEERGSRLVRVDDTAVTSWSSIAHRFGHDNRRIIELNMTGGTDGLRTLVGEHFRQGLQAIEPIDEVAVVAMPDIMPKPVVKSKQASPPPADCHSLAPALQSPPSQSDEAEFPPPLDEGEIEELQQELVAHCTMQKDRVAILDVQDIRDPQLAVSWRRQFDTRYAALYYPWLDVPDPLRLEGLLRRVPPSGHVAGVYARGDLTVGVHKPPANEELIGVQDLAVATDEIVHGLLNQEHINVIHTVEGRGIRVNGARTLSSEPEWRYINVRRLVIMIEEALDEQLQWTVFEPNDPALWGDIERVVRNFLRSLWRQGMLDGETPDAAFYVKCDQTTNPAPEVNQARLICEVGLNPPWPAEFVVVRIGITEGGAEIMEEG